MCRPHNCLNYTNVEPSVRNQHSKMNCTVPYASKDCASVTTWHPRKPVPCVADQDADVRGVCGTDQHCYTSDTTFPKVINEYKVMVNKFFEDSSIAQFNAFNKFVRVVEQNPDTVRITVPHSVYNPGAIAAYAKGATVYMALLQQLHLLGSGGQENEQLKYFAGTVCASTNNM